MRIVTLLGTRPEIIRLSRVITVMDALCEHTLIHTNQNYDASLSDIFFDELGLRRPDVTFTLQSDSFAAQIAEILLKSAEAFALIKPDRLLILGDTNSGLAAIVAARMGIPVFHLEAGNRCYDDRVPEEINRRVIDHCSKVLMPYTERSKENLVREGVRRERIFVVGNPIFEVLRHHAANIERSDVASRLGLQKKSYFLATLHRAENVDVDNRLEALLVGLSSVADEYELPMVVSVHPRTADKLAQFGLRPSSDRVRLIRPLGLFDFVHLEQNALCVLSDSGTVQEECAIFNVPNVTLRDVTERPETIECGSNILAGADRHLRLAVRTVLTTGQSWTPPPEYVVRDVSRTVAKIMLGVVHQ